jgi:hypothetical protein
MKGRLGFQEVHFCLILGIQVLIWIMNPSNVDVLSVTTFPNLTIITPVDLIEVAEWVVIHYQSCMRILLGIDSLPPSHTGLQNSNRLVDELSSSNQRTQTAACQ